MKATFRQFRTGLLATDYHEYSPAPFNGKSWRAELIEPHTEFPIASVVVGDRIYPAREVVITARDDETAQRAANLIHAARLLIEGSSFFSHVHPGEHAPILELSDASATNDFPPQTPVVTPDIPLACLIAARASLKLQYVYALAKIRLSFETYSLPVIRLDPHHSENIPKSVYPEDHVRLGFAIVMAYSSIEELGFAINASSDKPAKIGGNWNPLVKEDLEARLVAGHVDLKEQFHWTVRGARTLIEKKRTPEIVKKARWARYPVRDGKMEVIDAINYVSFLRSKVSTHRADKRLVRVLSVYDVANAQMLARRLLLERMGYWRDWEQRSKGLQK